MNTFEPVRAAARSGTPIEIAEISAISARLSIALSLFAAEIEPSEREIESERFVWNTA